MLLECRKIETIGTGDLTESVARARLHQLKETDGQDEFVVNLIFLDFDLILTAKRVIRLTRAYPR